MCSNAILRSDHLYLSILGTIFRQRNHISGYGSRGRRSVWLHLAVRRPHKHKLKMGASIKTASDAAVATGLLRSSNIQLIFDSDLNAMQSSANASCHSKAEIVCWLLCCGRKYKLRTSCSLHPHNPIRVHRQQAALKIASNQMRFQKRHCSSQASLHEIEIYDIKWWQIILRNCKMAH